MSENIIVTGGAGFIGSHLVDRLIEGNHKVMVIDNLSTGYRENINDKAIFREADIRDENTGRIIRNFNPDYFFHLAAQIDVRKSLERPLWDEEINIRGTLNILECLSGTDIKKFIFSSTGGAIYGEARGVDESTLPEPLSPYGVGKLTDEHYLRVYGKWRHVPFTVLRYGNVYGPRQDPSGEAGVVAIFCKNFLRGEKPVLYGFGSMIRDYVYVEDVVNANLKAMSGGEGEIFNIGTGNPVSVKRLFEILKKVSGKNIKPDLKEKREGEIQETYLSIGKAKRELNWTPETSIEEGIARTFRWFKDNGFKQEDR